MIYTIPGLRNSGPDHWQSHWEKKYPDKIKRINQHNWDAPTCGAWVQQIEHELRFEDYSKTILVGHSVGCAAILHAAILHWYAKWGHPLKGALLVAPSDVDRKDYPSYIKGFSPMPLLKLPFKTVVVASTNDHVVSLERAQFFAGYWGSEFVVLQNAGHVEGKSGYGEWKEGLELLFN